MLSRMKLSQPLGTHDPMDLFPHRSRSMRSISAFGTCVIRRYAIRSDDIQKYRQFKVQNLDPVAWHTWSGTLEGQFGGSRRIDYKNFTGVRLGKPVVVSFPAAASLNVKVVCCGRGGPASAMLVQRRCKRETASVGSAEARYTLRLHRRH